MLLEQTTKQHQIEKQILEEKIAKLSQDNISLKQESIPKDDETLVTYQYLRD
jgi:translation elongation factor EF-Ts